MASHLEPVMSDGSMKSAALICVDIILGYRTERIYRSKQQINACSTQRSNTISSGIKVVKAADLQ